MDTETEKRLNSFVNDKKQFRNSGARNLALLLLNREKERVDAPVPIETIEEVTEEECKVEECECISTKPIEEEEVKEEPEGVFEMDDVSVGTVEEVEDDEISLAISELECSVQGDDESVNGDLETVKVGSYSFSNKTCADCAKVREKYSYNGGKVKPQFNFFDSSFCKKCKRKQYQTYKKRKAEHEEQQRIEKINNEKVATRTVNNMKINDLAKLKRAKDDVNNSRGDRDKELLKETLKDVKVKKNSNLALNLYIR